MIVKSKFSFSCFLHVGLSLSLPTLLLHSFPKKIPLITKKERNKEGKKEREKEKKGQERKKERNKQNNLTKKQIKRILKDLEKKKERKKQTNKETNKNFCQSLQMLTATRDHNYFCDKTK